MGKYHPLLPKVPFVIKLKILFVAQRKINFRYFFITQREIILNGHNLTHFANVVKNHRYNIITFIPFVIIEQLRHFSNAFYIILLISQFFPPLKVGFLADYLAPILIVFAITFIKEGYDDYQRYKKDVEANNQLLTKVIILFYNIAR